MTWRKSWHILPACWTLKSLNIAVKDATYAVGERKPDKNEKFRLAGIRTLTSAIPVQCSNQYVLGTLRSVYGGCLRRRAEVWNTCLPTSGSRCTSIPAVYTLLSDKFRAKIRDEEKASWIDTDLSNVENALKKIAEKEAVVEETAQNEKKKEGSAKAAEKRNWEL